LYRTVWALGLGRNWCVGCGEQIGKAVEGKNLALEDAAKVSGSAVYSLGKGWRGGLRRLEFERRDGAVRDAAGDNELEIAKVRRDVQREAMRSDELRDVNADGSDLLFEDGAAGIGPDAGALADALRGHGKIFACKDERFFNEANEIDRTEVWAALAGKISAEIEDGITDELAGAVVRDVTTALGLVNFDALARE